jgi:hypothetical protein
VVLFALRGPAPPPWRLPPQIDVVPAAAAHHRGKPAATAAVAAPGDEVTVRWAHGGQPLTELRVWRGGELVFRCAGNDPRCPRRGRWITARVPLSLAGVYQPLLVWNAGPLPPPAGGATEDEGRIVAAGGRVLAVDPIAVR